MRCSRCELLGRRSPLLPRDVRCAFASGVGLLLESGLVSTRASTLLPIFRSFGIASDSRLEPLPRSGRCNVSCFNSILPSALVRISASAALPLRRIDLFLSTSVIAFSSSLRFDERSRIGEDSDAWGPRDVLLSARSEIGALKSFRFPAANALADATRSKVSTVEGSRRNCC